MKLGRNERNDNDSILASRGFASFGSLVAAGALFVVGLYGLFTVIPYTPPAPWEPLFVTSPSSTPAPRPDATAWVADKVPAIETYVVRIEETQEPEPTPTEEPEVIAVAAPQSQVQPAQSPPTPTPTPEPTPTATPQATEEPEEEIMDEEPELVEEPTATPTQPPDFVPRSGEQSPSRPNQPVAAFFDGDLQQPGPNDPHAQADPHPLHSPPPDAINGNGLD
jgi:hypothetical protein